MEVAVQNYSSENRVPVGIYESGGDTRTLIPSNVTSRPPKAGLWDLFFVHGLVCVRFLLYAARFVCDLMVFVHDSLLEASHEGFRWWIDHPQADQRTDPHWSNFETAAHPYCLQIRILSP